MLSSNLTIGTKLKCNCSQRHFDNNIGHSNGYPEILMYKMSCGPQLHNPYSPAQDQPNSLTKCRSDQ